MYFARHGWKATVVMPGGTAHRARNGGPDAVEFLLVSQPPAQMDREEA